MKPRTVGDKYDIGKIAPVQCIKNDTFKDLEIKGQCFLLVIVYDGTISFQVGDYSFEATAPCFICFDEHESPKLIKKRGLVCDSVYFHPVFLNVNMSFERLRSGDYNHLALSHDMFLLKPFIDEDRYVFPIFEDYINSLKNAFQELEKELVEQRDWYWSCRSRSYFMEIILMLERVYGLFDQEYYGTSINRIINPHLKKAVIYIESNYKDNIRLENISDAAQINHSSLTKLFKQELNMTAIDYLWDYRLTVAKKLLQFTNLPVKDIASRCGFKTVQHFIKRFDDYNGISPSKFRFNVVAARKAAFKALK